MGRDRKNAKRDRPSGDRAMDDKRLKVGELARRTGLTVRTLHHYDEIGLLAPAARTPSGHRLYGRAEVLRLQRIASLKLLGLSLEEIREGLDAPGTALAPLLETQIERVREHIDRQRELLGHLERLRDRLRTDDPISVDDLTRTIRMTMDYARYYTPEQLEQLARRREEVGEARMEAAQAEWTELFAAYRQAMEEGLDPTDERVQRLAAKSEALIDEFTGGDEAIRASLANLYRSEGGPAVTSQHGVETDQDLWTYMGRANAARGAASE